VELMVVIVIVGILSAVALPKFLGLKDKAKINTQLGEASGLAKECATAIIADGTYPANYITKTGGLTNTGLKITGTCNKAGAAPDTDIVFTTTAAKGTEGVTCGPDDLTALKPKCVITVTASTGDINYAAT